MKVKVIELKKILKGDFRNKDLILEILGVDELWVSDIFPSRKAICDHINSFYPSLELYKDNFLVKLNPIKGYKNREMDDQIIKLRQAGIFTPILVR